MSRKVGVQGLKELDKALGQLTEAAGKRVLRQVGREALEPFDAAWRSEVHVKWGTLRDSGGVGSKLTKSDRRAHERENTVEVFAGPGPNPQAITEEFGTIDQAPHPVVTQAWDRTQDQVLDNVASGLWEPIEKAARRQARRTAKLAKG